MGQTERSEALQSLDALFDIADAREPMWLEGASRRHYGIIRQALSAPDGFALVPTEPTLQMQNAGWRVIDEQGVQAEDTEVAPIYRAMIEAADPQGVER